MNESIELSKIKEFRNLIKDAYTDLMSKGKFVSNAVGKAYINAKLEAWALVIKSIDEIIKGEEEAMANINQDLIRQVVRMEDVVQHKRSSVWEEKVLSHVETAQYLLDEETAKAKKERRPVKLPALPIFKVEPTLTYNHYSGLISKMKEEGKIANVVRVLKAGKEFYLVPEPSKERELSKR